MTTHWLESGVVTNLRSKCQAERSTAFAADKRSRKAECRD